MPRLFGKWRLALCAGVFVCMASCDPGSERLTPRVESVSIAGAPITLQVGEEIQLTAVVTSTGGKKMEGRPVYWGAVNSTIVQVDPETGTARALAPGTTQVAASSEDKSGVADITVPEGPALASGALVNDELSPEDDADEFTFNGVAGELVNLFLRGASEVSSHRFRLRLLGPSRNVVDSLISFGSDTALRRQGLKWLALPQGGLYRVRVDANLGGGRGKYQVELDRVNPLPELVPPQVSAGDTVKNESLGPGDIDEFTFTGSAGQYINVFFQATSGRVADVLKLRVIQPNGSELVFLQSNGDYQANNLILPSGRLALTQTGKYTIRVEGLDAEDSGPYKFYFISISPTPEGGVLPGIVPGNVVKEAIFPVGDLDVFTFTLDSPQEVNVYMRALPGTALDTLVFLLHNSSRSIHPAGTITGRDTILTRQGLSFLNLPKGQYFMEVEGGRNTRRGYEFLVRPIHLAPERARDTVFFNSYVTDSISPVGDVDEYTLNANARDSVQVGFQALSGSSSDVMDLFLYDRFGTLVLSVHSTANQGEQTKSVRLQVSGNYRIRVKGVSSTDDFGPYRFRVKLN